MEDKGRRLIELQTMPGGVAAGIHSKLRPGRYEVSTLGEDPFLQLFGSDPYNSPSYTGLMVPTAPTTTAQNRYLFQLARASFNVGEVATLRGIRQYASLWGFDEGGGGPFEQPITNPMWRFFSGGNISWHVMVVAKTWRDRRNPANRAGIAFLDTSTPALLYQTLGPYTAPNGGRPWGKPIAHDIGNFHDIRYPWMDSQTERELCIPIPPNSDVVVYASVWQHDTRKTAPEFSTSQLANAPVEDKFWASFANVQYGRIAASLIFEEGQQE